MPRKAKADPPAKKETKASLIRAYKADHPAEGPTAISKSLTAQGVPVSAAMVSTTLSNAAKGKASKRPGRPPKAADPYAAIIAANRFVESVGGIAKAEEALTALAAIVG